MRLDSTVYQLPYPCAAFRIQSIPSKLVSVAELLSRTLRSGVAETTPVTFYVEYHDCCLEYRCDCTNPARNHTEYMNGFRRCQNGYQGFSPWEFCTLGSAHCRSRCFKHHERSANPCVIATKLIKPCRLHSIEYRVYRILLKTASEN